MLRLIAELHLQPVAHSPRLAMVFDEDRPAAFKRAEEISLDAIRVRGGGEAIIHSQPEEQTVGDGAWPLGRAGCCRS